MRPSFGSTPRPDSRRLWAVQAAAMAERGARNGDLITTDMLRAIAARQSALAVRPAAEMACVGGVL